jgi:hypothetical protein
MKTHTKLNLQTIPTKLIILVVMNLLLIMSLLLICSINSCKKPNEGLKLTVNESELAKAPVLLHLQTPTPIRPTSRVILRLKYQVGIPHWYKWTAAPRLIL